jgi:hypothetical protein
MEQSPALSHDLSTISANLTTVPSVLGDPPPKRLHGLSAPRQAALKLKRDLIVHCGGAPSVVQLALIDTLCALKVKIEVFDRRFIESGGMSAHDRREYLSFVNSYGRLMRQLGTKAVAPRGPSLAEYLAEKAAKPASNATIAASTHRSGKTDTFNAEAAQRSSLDAAEAD